MNINPTMYPTPDFAKVDLIPVVVQDQSTGDVLMLAWMNAKAWKATLDGNEAVYWSRSRQRLWRKGEQSGNRQIVREVLLDCDLDSILLKVDQMGGAACHTGHRSCFHKRISQNQLITISKPVFNPKDVYKLEKKNRKE